MSIGVKVYDQNTKGCFAGSYSCVNKIRTNSPMCQQEKKELLYQKYENELSYVLVSLP
jgi:hypothetical protein